jgi:imidazolonepropionase-like amidohydrolase
MSAFALAAAALALQSAQIPAPPQATPVALIRATVHTSATNGPATVADGHVLFVDGRITSVGPGLPAAMPAGTRVLDATGLHVAPGFFIAPTQIGLVETLATVTTDDRSEFGSVHPEAVAAVAINPDTDLFPVARAAGILHALVVPTGGLVSGQPSVVRLDGWTNENLTVEREAGVAVNWPLMEPVIAWWTRKPAEEQQKRIKQDLETLEKFALESKAWLDRADAFPETPLDLRFAAMRGVSRAGKPVYISCGSAGQVEAALAWASRHGYRPVIVGGPGIGESIPALRRANAAVLLNGIHRLPARDVDAYDEPYALPARLEAAGIPFAIATGDEPAHDRNLPHHAGTAAAFGLSKEAALRAITRSPAEICGVGDRLGSLEAGKSASLIVTTGDPLEITSDVLAAFIDGREVDLGSRHKRLFAKYREKYQQLGLLPPPAPVPTVPEVTDGDPDD